MTLTDGASLGAASLTHDRSINSSRTDSFSVTPGQSSAELSLCLRSTSIQVRKQFSQTFLMEWKMQGFILICRAMSWPNYPAPLQMRRGFTVPSSGVTQCRMWRPLLPTELIKTEIVRNKTARSCTLHSRIWPCWCSRTERM